MSPTAPASAPWQEFGGADPFRADRWPGQPRGLCIKSGALVPSAGLSVNVHPGPLAWHGQVPAPGSHLHWRPEHAWVRGQARSGGDTGVSPHSLAGHRRWPGLIPGSARGPFQELRSLAPGLAPFPGPAPARHQASKGGGGGPLRHPCIYLPCPSGSAQAWRTVRTVNIY